MRDKVTNNNFTRQYIVNLAIYFSLRDKNYFKHTILSLFKPLKNISIIIIIHRCFGDFLCKLKQ